MGLNVVVAALSEVYCIISFNNLEEKKSSLKTNPSCFNQWSSDVSEYTTSIWLIMQFDGCVLEVFPSLFGMTNYFPL